MSRFLRAVAWSLVGVVLVAAGPIAAGLLVVTVASFLVLFLLQRILPKDDASSLWLFASFPTAFYLSVVYAEGLFLAALLGLIWALRAWKPQLQERD